MIDETKPCPSRSVRTYEDAERAPRFSEAAQVHRSQLEPLGRVAES